MRILRELFKGRERIINSPMGYLGIEMHLRSLEQQPNHQLTITYLHDNTKEVIVDYTPQQAIGFINNQIDSAEKEKYSIKAHTQVFAGAGKRKRYMNLNIAKIDGQGRSEKPHSKISLEYFGY